MKSNKGITLIALVVTIIILLILAGVSITTLSGNGLFGRAESSAAKYQAASEAENSTISSLMDKYDNYESEIAGMTTVSWNSPIAERGSFINSLNPESTRNSNFYDKEIVAIKPNGEKQLLNPYQATSVRVPDGTTLRFYCYCDKTSDYTCLGVRKGTSAPIVEALTLNLADKAAPVGSRMISMNQWDLKDGSLQYVEMTLSGYSEARFTLYYDGIDEGDITYNVWEVGCVTTNRANNGNYRLSWNAPLAERGSFINSANPESSRNSNFSDKVIVAVKPNGTKEVINPYQSGSILVPPGTKIRFYTYKDKTKDLTGILVHADSVMREESSDHDGSLIYVEWTLPCSARMYLGSDDTGTVEEDFSEEEYRGKTYSEWEINCSPDFDDSGDGLKKVPAPKLPINAIDQCN